MYGVPKIHKEDNPLRPILSMVNAPRLAMAKWLTQLLKPVVSKVGNHTIKDSFEFCKILDEYCTNGDFSPENSFMCSFDVLSLFTNIPLEETITICLETLYRDCAIFDEASHAHGSMTHTHGGRRTECRIRHVYFLILQFLFL